MVGQAREEVTRIGHITRNTLALQRETTFPVSLSLSEIIDGVCRLFESPLAQKRIRLERQYETSGQMISFAWRAAAGVHEPDRQRRGRPG